MTEKGTTSDVYVLIDRATRNIIAERETLDEAEAVLLAYAGNYPPAADDLEIVGADGLRHSVARTQVERVAPGTVELAEA